MTKKGKRFDSVFKNHCVDRWEEGKGERLRNVHEYHGSDGKQGKPRQYCPREKQNKLEI